MARLHLCMQRGNKFPRHGLGQEVLLRFKDVFRSGFSAFSKHRHKLFDG